MAQADPILAAPSALPAGYFAVPLFPQGGSPISLSVIVRKDPDPVAGHFVTLRTLLDAVVYLGCLTDAGNKVHGYVEIWVQSLNGLADSPAAALKPFPTVSSTIVGPSSSRLTIVSTTLVAGVWGGGGISNTIYRTGFETAHPRPFFYDPEKRELLQPSTPSPTPPWKLCTDDAFLTAKVSPAYSSSLHRYLTADAKSPSSPSLMCAPAGPNTAAHRNHRTQKHAQALQPRRPHARTPVRARRPRALLRSPLRRTLGRHPRRPLRRPPEPSQ